MKRLATIALGLFLGQAQAADLLPSKRLGLDLARDIAQATVDACRKGGYQVSVVVVDRNGDPMVVMRDSLASRYTLDIARRKAGAAVLGGVATSELARNRADISDALNHIEGILVLAGGVPIRAAGALVGAVGVSGAPGGDKDEACARAGIESLEERLEWAD